jgi:serine/threonine protein kinase
MTKLPKDKIETTLNTILTEIDFNNTISEHIYINSIPKQNPPKTKESSTNTIEKIKIIGEGGMSKVWLAKQTSLDREIAIKESKEDNYYFKDLLIREAMILGRLEHPNIPPIHDIDRSDNTEKFLFKLIRGETLTEKLNKCSTLSDRVYLAIPVLLQICDALRYSHENGFIHRDIKPDNIMICNFGEKYLIDWGISLDLNNRKSCKNVIVGTPHYIAPEMVSTNPIYSVDHRTDVYLLGATLHEILTGKKKHDNEIISNIFNFVHDFEPYEFTKDLHIFSTVCNKACARDPIDRFQSIYEFQECLKKEYEIFKSQSILIEAEKKLFTLKMITQGKLQPNNRTHAHTLYSQSRFAFEEILRKSPENIHAHRGIEEVKIMMFNEFIKQKQLECAVFLQDEILNLPKEELEKLHILETELIRSKQHEIRNQILENEFDISFTLNFRTQLSKLIFVSTLILWTLWLFDVISKDFLFLESTALISSMVIGFTVFNWKAFYLLRFPRVVSFLGMGFGFSFFLSMMGIHHNIQQYQIIKYFNFLLLFMLLGALANLKSNYKKRLVILGIAIFSCFSELLYLELYMVNLLLFSICLSKEWNNHLV